ncbi:MAG: peptidylprolyl isomerase [Acidimicrobiia bacterium]
MSKQYDTPPEFTIDLSKVYTATLTTNHGDIEIALDAERSPQTVNNFVHLARDAYYDGCIFHRVISGFMVQGGDPTGTGRGGPGYKFRDEIEGEGNYTRGTVAMANAGPNTNGSQFFICHADTGLPHSYTIFGTVTTGMEAVDSIAGSSTDHSDRPHDEVVIEKVVILES